jgi:hypothetical protein
MIEKVLYNIYINENNEISICNEKGCKGIVTRFQIRREMERKVDPNDHEKYLIIPGNKTIGNIDFEIKDEEK